MLNSVSRLFGEEKYPAGGVVSQAAKQHERREQGGGGESERRSRARRRGALPLAGPFTHTRLGRNETRFLPSRGPWPVQPTGVPRSQLGVSSIRATTAPQPTPSQQTHKILPQFTSFSPLLLSAPFHPIKFISPR